MKFIKEFEKYDVNESAGYGNEYFFEEKHEKSQYYFFKAGEGSNETGLILKIGKFSRESVISDAENSYGILHIEKLSHNDMDDYLVNDREYVPNDEEIFTLPTETISQAFEILPRALDNYLEKNPKVTKFYDEILTNLSMDSKKYLEFITPIINDWSDGKWTIQEGSTKHVLIYTKNSHE